LNWDGVNVDKYAEWGWSGAMPVLGDWNGDGKTKIGVYAIGGWFLDYNGTFAWSQHAYAALGWSGALPVPSKWNGTAATQIGIFQDVAWMVDHNANLTWDGSPPDRLFYWGGVSGDIPVPGKW
jgi:hypothetical protein